MTKDVGRVVLERMVLEGILLRENWGYVLDTDMLAQLIGVTYGDCMAYRFGDKAIAFANRALSSGTESATGH